MGLYEKWSEARTKIPPGKYHVRCVEAKKPKIWIVGRGGWGKIDNRVALWFEVVEGPHAGAILPMFLNVDIKKNGKVPDGSKYYEAWMVANGGFRPRRARFKEMNPSIFPGKSFMAEVWDSHPKWIIPGKEDPVEKPEQFHYSKVQILYEVVTGHRG